MKVYVVWGAIPYDQARVYGVYSDLHSAEDWVKKHQSPGYFRDPWAEEYWIRESDTDAEES